MKLRLKVTLKDFNIPSNEGQFNARKYYTSLDLIIVQICQIL